MFNKKIIKSILIVLAVFSTSFAYADGSVADMFANSKQAWIALSKLTQFIAVIIGFYLIIGAVIKFSNLGSSPQATAKQPIFMFLIGVALFAITPSISTVYVTMFSEPMKTVLVPAGGGGNCGPNTGDVMQSIFMFIKLVGIIAFIRGWLLLNQAAAGKEGMIGRGLVHIGGGVAAMNVVVVAKMLKATFFKSLPTECFGI